MRVYFKREVNMGGLEKKYCKLLVVIVFCIFIFACAVNRFNMKKNIYDFRVKDSDGKEISLKKYRGKVLLIVNTASKCGFTPQYKELQMLYDKYKGRGFFVLAFPCNQFAHQEPKKIDEIKKFCSLNYGVSFPIFSKIEVNGENAEPLFKYLKHSKGGFITDNIKWNFTKFLVGKNGETHIRYAPFTSPAKIAPDIERELNKE
jgi:glutathione peroxidase